MARMAAAAPSSPVAVCEQPEQPQQSTPPASLTLADVVWRNVLLLGFVHAMALYGVVLVFTSAHPLTTAFAAVLVQVTGLGITAGAHRLWSHRSYKATLPLRVFIMLLNCMAFQGTIFDWARDHRVHHKYSDTNADPYNPQRGLFYSHLGWLLVRKNADVREKGRQVDMSDLLADPVVTFQRKYYFLGLAPLLGFALPTAVPMLLWGETFLNAWCVPTMLRFALTLNGALSINSVAHKWGYKPFDKSIWPSDLGSAAASVALLGEGSHNYHHVFPWDYRSAEAGGALLPNSTTAFIDACARLGLAHGLKSAGADLVRKRAARTGDGSHAPPRAAAGERALAGRPTLPRFT